MPRVAETQPIVLPRDPMKVWFVSRKGSCDRRLDCGSFVVRRRSLVAPTPAAASPYAPRAIRPAGTQNAEIRRMFPTRDTVVRYLQDYARLIDVPIELEVCVKRIVAAGDGWRLKTDSNRTVGHVIVATGHVRQPFVRRDPGYTDRLIHAAEFGQLSQYAGKSVLVVGGAGNSGTDALNHLATIETGPISGLRAQRPRQSSRRGSWACSGSLPSWKCCLYKSSTSTKALAATKRMAFGNLRRLAFANLPPARRPAYCAKASRRR